MPPRASSSSASKDKERPQETAKRAVVHKTGSSPTGPGSAGLSCPRGRGRGGCEDRSTLPNGEPATQSDSDDADRLGAGRGRGILAQGRHGSEHQERRPVGMAVAGSARAVETMSVPNWRNTAATIAITSGTRIAATIGRTAPVAPRARISTPAGKNAPTTAGNDVLQRRPLQHGPRNGPGEAERLAVDQ